VRALLYLPHDVAAFRPTSIQIERLRSRVSWLDLRVALDHAEFDQRLPDAELVIVWSFGDKDYNKARQLQWVATPSAGHERIATPPSGRCRVTHGSFHGPIIAESLAAMMGFMNRRFGLALAAQHTRVWERDLYSSTRPLCGQVALIVGYGAIGRHMRDVLGNMGLKVSGLKRDVTRGVDGLEEVYPVSEIELAVASADHIVCILPGTRETQHLLNAKVFACMKSSACVYNLGRGGAIDVSALAGALLSGRIAGAFLDVFPDEPLPKDSELWGLPNLYLTPHASAIRRDYLDLYFDELASLLEASR
jgi:D-2-hydroxyacid dehydrogenase (NADP+)